MKRILFATAMLLPAIGARAADVAPMAGFERTFRTGASALIYFTPGPDGYRVVTTVQSDDAEAPTVLRFIAILAAGQTTEVSVPQGPGQAPDAIVIRRVGDRLVVEEPVTVALAAP
jgi:hypothetical protein